MGDPGRRVFGNRAIANVALQSRFPQARFQGGFSSSAWPWWLGGSVLGWFGPVFWPYAYYDLFDYVYWPYAYDDFWPYAYDDVYYGIYGPYAYNDPGVNGRGVSYGRYGGSSRRYAATTNGPRPRAAEVCSNQAPELTDWPIERISEVVQPTDAQRQALDELRAASAKAIEILQSGCPKDLPSIPIAAAAYNAGPQRVQDWLCGKRTLPSETLAYVRSVTGHSAEEWKRPDARTWQVSIASDTPCVETTRLAAKPAPAAPSAPPAPSAAWTVQVIGDRLESNALSRYAQLQKKYQAILGGREPLVVRTTMGNAAIWHRIAIAANTREAAETLCSRLRAAGGSCLVQSI